MNKAFLAKSALLVCSTTVAIWGFSQSTSVHAQVATTAVAEPLASHIAELRTRQHDLLEWQVVLEGVYYHNSTSKAARLQVSQAGIADFKNALAEIEADFVILEALNSKSNAETTSMQRETTDRLEANITRADVLRRTLAKAVLTHCLGVSDKVQLDLFTK